uniref:Uncharacterized protein n=1 Tax=Romanomermis culicivorax TaxID=13658 RepID=A0A915IZ59_ROMCU
MPSGPGQGNALDGLGTDSARASVRPLYQLITLPTTVPLASSGPSSNCSDSTDSFVHVEPPLAQVITQTVSHDHHSSLAIANVYEVKNSIQKPMMLSKV